ncbi:PepSY-associated TM helix domain-containing protein [Flavobacterium sp. H122]|uniref:PepSY-associated TM helix domain-containing protein n=1 Tax=Flavobacterium sp. H122 TaxID=2529860 RepID=UPI0010AA9CB4|nr:PepSY-associated TM helix domain-containing protein [Flavobacterium sp. H122]
MNRQTIRSLHRDLGYFYLGLIISFSLSGILMNHRESFHPEKYDIEKKEIQVQLPAEDQITEEFAKDFLKKQSIDDTFRRFKVKGGAMRISCKNTDVEVDLATGKGEIESYKKTPFISQIMKLHKNTSNWWIYYGDIFGLSLIFIAVTGVYMIPAGKFSFKNRGWKLAVAGIVFPLIVLFILS